VIRRAVVEDAVALASLQIRAWEAAYSSYVSAEQLAEAGDATARTRRWREILAGRHGGATTFVAIDDGGVLQGFVSVGESRDEDARPGDGELYAIYVEPALIGSGVGRALLDHGERELARSYRAAVLWVFEPNAVARRFYERHGWRPDDAPFDTGRWDWAPSLRYRKELTPAVLVSVTDHAIERFRQRVAGRLDPRPEIAGRVAEAWAAGRVERGERGSVLVRDLADRDVVYVCRHDAPRGELVVVTLWEEGEDARVPRRFTDVLRPTDEHPRRA
jgi:GNAT superfamily N-acetyltransferase